MFSLFHQVANDAVLAIIVILISVAYTVNYMGSKLRWSIVRSVGTHAVISAIIILYLHPGTSKPYPFYVVGWIAKYGEYTAPHHSVEWSRTEITSSELVQSYGPQRPPNVILILADDLGYNDLSGGAGVQTPNIDSIYRNGVSFTQAYSGHATCSPARAALLTGRYPSRFGFEYTAVHWLFAWAITRPKKTSARQPIFHYGLLNKVPKESEMVCPTSEILISNALKKRNYSTAYIGKWHLGETVPALPNNRAFDETLVFLRGGSKYLQPNNHPDGVNAYLDDPLDVFLWDNMLGNVRHNGSARFPPDEYITDYFGKQAASVIRTKLAAPVSAARTVPPLFLTVAFNAPHTPLQALRSDYESPELYHIKDHTKRVYAAMIKSLDRSVGYILDAVKETDQADNTMVIFTSDNGGPGYVGIPDINRPLRGWKATFFEGGFRVPLFISWPGVISLDSVYDRPVSHVDIFTTVVAAAGGELSTDRAYDGIDLRPHLERAQRGTHDWDPHKSLFWRTGTYLAYREANWKLQVSLNPDRVWFTDLAEDMEEKLNLVNGLLWTNFRALLLSSAVNDCPEQLTLLIPSSVRPDVLALACDIGRNMLSVQAEQSEPLWPGLAEVPMPVDMASFTVNTLEEEHVYWTN
jgi:arylsulfatase A-like enzyme